ncbi:MAG TPA: response regulator transcription factor [Actinophytocola sp.]|jgi:DNA-binding NarL/FixJ family response regulator|uniref:response regulator transcription factor n=1 Tax=Actinophytocola sp. TaxID=1872138 RepID=UPI002F943716
MPVSTQQQPGRATSTIGVALIDGTPLVREGLSSLLNRTAGLRFLGSAESAQVGLRLCQRLRPDVVLVDAALDPRGQLSHVLSAAGGSMRVLLLIDDARRTNQYIAGALAAGVAGVIRRSAQPNELLRAIQAVHTEGRYLDPALAPALAAPAPRAQQTPRQPLSRREHQVLQLIADGLENQAIADILYVSVETVRTHVKSILRKLSSRDRTHAVAVAFRSGVLVVDEQSPGSRPARD